jgi:hypothetical protein
MPETKKTVYAGIFHDAYTDEDGKENNYDARIAGIWETEESFYAVDFDGFVTFHLSKEEFQNKVTDVKTVF